MEEAKKECGKRAAAAEPRTIENLQNASDHLHYEVWMMQSLPNEYVLAQQAVAAAQVRANAFLEAFVVHARVLMDFLYRDDPWPDDVVAAKFFDAPEQWTGVRKPLTELSVELQRVNGRVGKEVAHLTFARNEITAEMKNWQIGKIAQELSAQFDVFLKLVPKNKLSSTWPQANGRQR